MIPNTGLWIMRGISCYWHVDFCCCSFGRDSFLRKLKLKRRFAFNNLSESDILEYVKRRKISGGTRSELGRRCRDTFASLKKTSRKLGISFWDYVKDRITGAGCIARLPALIEAHTQAS